MDGKKGIYPDKQNKEVEEGVRGEMMTKTNKHTKITHACNFTTGKYHCEGCGFGYDYPSDSIYCSCCQVIYEKGAKDEQKRCDGERFLDLLKRKATKIENAELNEKNLSPEELAYKKGAEQGAKDEREKLIKPTPTGSCQVCGNDDAVIKAYERGAKDEREKFHDCAEDCKEQPIWEDCHCYKKGEQAGRDEFYSECKKGVFECSHNADEPCKCFKSGCLQGGIILLNKVEEQMVINGGRIAALEKELKELKEAPTRLRMMIDKDEKIAALEKKINELNDTLSDMGYEQSAFIEIEADRDLLWEENARLRKSLENIKLACESEMRISKPLADAGNNVARTAYLLMFGVCVKVKKALECDCDGQMDCDKCEKEAGK